MGDHPTPDAGTVSRGWKVLLGTIFFGGTAFVILHNWLGVGGASLDGVTGGSLYDAVVVSAGLALLLRARASKTDRTAWALIGIAVLTWGAGEIYWALFVVNDPTPPYPSPADAGYLGFYLFAYAGIALLIRSRAHELDWRLWTDGLIAALGTAALGTLLVFDFVAARTTGTTWEVAATLAYPLNDIALISLIACVIALSSWRLGRTWGLLLAGLAATAVADIAYSVEASQGVLAPGNWIDPVYLLSAAFFGALMWQPNAATIQTTQVSERRELMVPGIFAAFMIGLAIMQYIGGSSGLSTVLWAMTITAVIVRLALAVRTNRALLEQVQTDPLTQLSNRGRMQVDLKNACASASADSPAALYLFDLNGFKRYNDTFGHPAGDELLIQLGRALQRAVGDDGVAYRIGGDEFCVLFTCVRSRFDAMAKKTAEALTASDRGVEVSASWGGAVIPDDADSPSEALQLADVRMYAQKESRRVAGGDGPQPRLSEAAGQPASTETPSPPVSAETPSQPIST